MSLNKAIEHGKERRKKHRGSKAFDSSCRHGGSCSYCRNNRLYQRKKAETEVEDKLKEYAEGEADGNDSTD